MTNTKFSELIETYLEGWKIGNGVLSLSATNEEFTYDDTDTGTIQREDFVDFVNDFKSLAMEMGAAENTQPFLKYTRSIEARFTLTIEAKMNIDSGGR